MTELKKINENKFVLKKQNQMLTDGVVYINDKLMQGVDKNALKQLENVASLPGILDNAYAMPDVHSGYGFPIGGVAAFDSEEGIVSPGGIGFDINCGVRLLRTNMTKEEFFKNRDSLKEELFSAVPTGLGSESKFRLEDDEFKEMLCTGIDWAIKYGIATKDDKESTEDYGHLETNAEFISQRAYKRGKKQIGTLGSGNHFIDVLLVDEIFEPKLAKKFKLEKDSVVILVHTGSRGLGHQVATDYLNLFLDSTKKYNIKLQDPQLAYLPLQSKEGKEYIDSMYAAANFAYVNRQMITHNIREVLEKYSSKAELVYDIAHNIAKFEPLKINGKRKEVFIHRKGATRALSKDNPLLPDKYSDIGQPVLIPGSMGTHSYLFVGDEAEDKSLGSIAHGAGRAMSRYQAKKEHNLDSALNQLTKQDIKIKASHMGGIIEEYTSSYKDIETVVEVIKANKLAKPVVNFLPKLVLIG
jgi:tRNA-splicing ligase RtcB (3'-phosphate/5'-hydroxy nucleic acid ligase)